MRVSLYRHSLDVRSGTGQLLRMQARELRARGVDTELVCERGALRFWWRTGLRARHATPRELAARARDRGAVVVDHSLRVPSADLVFVHNLVTEAQTHLPRADWRDQAGAERAFFAELASETLVVANSALVKDALTRHFDVDPARIAVHHPGYDVTRFRPERREELRRLALRTLGLRDGTPLVGFVTSGDFSKRGLDLFLQAAEQIVTSLPDVRFLVVGSKALPPWAKEHPLVAARKVEYRQKNARPELWIAALDLFLYAARFEEFGMVVLEALALGVPVLTSRRVGAAECLPPEYAPWVLPEPIPAALAEAALALLARDDLRRGLGAAGVARSVELDERRYAAGTVAAILAQNRRLSDTLTPPKS